MATPLKKALFVGFERASLSEASWRRLDDLADVLVLAERDSSAYLDALPDSEAVVLRLGAAWSASDLQLAPALRYVGMYGTGYGRIDIPACQASQVVVTNVADYSTRAVAEFVIAAMLNHLRDISGNSGRARAGDFSEPAALGRELGGTTVGVVGLGHIGMRVASTLSDGFGASVVSWNRTPKPEFQNSKVEALPTLEMLFERSDIVSLHLAHVAQTDGIVTESLVGRLKPGALLVNSAPNELVDLAAISNRCAAGKLHYVIDHLDELDPTEAARIVGTQGVEPFPPMGYGTVEAATNKEQILLDNLSGFLSGAPTNVVT